MGPVELYIEEKAGHKKGEVNWEHKIQIPSNIDNKKCKKRIHERNMETYRNQIITIIVINILAHFLVRS